MLTLCDFCQSMGLQINDGIGMCLSLDLVQKPAGSIFLIYLRGTR